MDINHLLTEIAACRCQMIRLSKVKSLTDPAVIELSQGLDISIYKYFEARRQQNVCISDARARLSKTEAVWDYV